MAFFKEQKLYEEATNRLNLKVSIVEQNAIIRTMSANLAERWYHSQSAWSQMWMAISDPKT